ncbi:Hypp9743 [Branchiostoma lanceolatum]|uniref:Hypp9743 protein n=1 Tax=Branchiostoma lanceolatum TaxID=7740 RepID=A0A8S4MNY9_BRALA|nr:Hypp9743 [Branchiostoma lanceolatum]
MSNYDSMTLDEMGDQPSRLVEFGQQRLGHYSCTCPADMRMVFDFWKSCPVHMQNPTPSIKDRQAFIMEGPVTSQKAALHTMTKEKMQDELTYRETPNTISVRRLLGHHLYSLRDHIPITYSVVAIRSTLAENEERQFSTLKRITRSSANYSKPGHI